MKLQNINVTFGERNVLNGLNLSLEEGKITAVLGESGAGKSTLLNVCAGLIPFEGEIEGTKKCSYLFQSANLLPNLTVEDNLKFVLEKHSWAEIPAMLEKVGLKGREKDFPRTLSGGEAQRVAIARAFLFPHELLLMDEPFSSLDLKLKSSLLSLVVSRWQERKNTVLFVTHDVREALLLSHQAVLLKEGKVQLSVPIDAPFPRNFFARFDEEETLVRALMGD